MHIEFNGAHLSQPIRKFKIETTAENYQLIEMDRRFAEVISSDLHLFFALSPLPCYSAFSIAKSEATGFSFTRDYHQVGLIFRFGFAEQMVHTCVPQLLELS